MIRREALSIALFVLVASCGGGRAEPVPARPGASAYPRVDADIDEIERQASGMEEAFDKRPADRRSREWAVAELAHLVEVDQFLRAHLVVGPSALAGTSRARSLPLEHRYSRAELLYFQKLYMRRVVAAFDSRSTRALKELLAIHGWFRIRTFGKAADENAFLIVQHSPDRSFQKEVLGTLEKLVATDDTGRQGYALLYDRVAVREGRPQRFGTQGKCRADGEFEPAPIDDPERLAERRRAMRMVAYDEYKREVSGQCVPPAGRARAAKPPGLADVLAEASAARDRKDWARCVELYLKARDLGGALEGLEAGVLYGAASCHALGGDKDSAFALLREAASAGLSKLVTTEGLARDPDMASLRSDPRWGELLNALAAGPSGR